MSDDNYFSHNSHCVANTFQGLLSLTQKMPNVMSSPYSCVMGIYMFVDSCQRMCVSVANLIHVLDMPDFIRDLCTMRRGEVNECISSTLQFKT